MKINLLSCDAPRPDRRAIANCLAEISADLNDSLASELTGMLLEGDEIEIEIKDKNSGSALGLLRKLRVDYEIVD
ncbi:MAG: hypothetical protein ACI8XB_001296 [Patiriisocius sp.]|jgi:hypothetical protein